MSASVPPKVPEHVFKNMRLKRDRAMKYIREIKDNCAAAPADWYRISVHEKTIVPQYPLHDHELRYEPTLCISDEFSLSIGDALNNVRSSLDYFASAVCRMNDAKSKPFFPVPETETSLDSNRDLKQMESVFPGIIDILKDTIRTQTENDKKLWKFTSVSNDDKHNFLAPVATISRISGITCETGNLMIDNLTRTSSADDSVVIVTSKRPIHLYGIPTVSFTLKFGPGSPLEGIEVINALKQLHANIDSLINRLYRLCS